jgi:hypothetical protein
MTNNQQAHNTKKPISTRRYCAFDLENLAGQAAVSADAGVGIAYLLQDILHLEPDDLVVTGGGTHNAFAVGEVSKILHGQTLCRGGHNGADLALIEHLDNIPSASITSLSAPINEVIIGSGDGIFTSVVRRLQNRGLVVSCIAYSRALHPALELACNKVIRLEQYINNQQAA